MNKQRTDASIKRQLVWHIFLTLFTIMVTQVYAQETQSYIELHQLALFKDPTGKMTFEQAQQQHFQPINQNINEGFTSDTIWVKTQLSLPKPINPQSRWVLQIQSAFQDHIDVYLEDATGRFQHFVSGDHEAQDEKLVSHRFPTFPIEITAEHSLTCYIQVQAKNTISFPLVLMTHREWNKQERSAYVWSGIFLGMSIILIVVSSMLVAFFNLWIFAHYLLFVLILATIRAILTGWGNLLLPIGWGDILTTLAQGALLLPLLYLSRSLLCLDQHFKQLFNLQLILAWLTFIWAIVCIVFDVHHWSTPLSQLIMLITLSILLFQSIALLKKEQLAKYYLIFFLYYICVIFFRIGVLQGWWESNKCSEMMISVGMVVQVLLIFFGIIYRSAKEREERLISNALAEQAHDEVEKRQLFMRLLSHELMTPLAIISASAQNLAFDLKPNAQQAQRRLLKMTNTIKKMKQLVTLCLTNEQIDSSQPSNQTSFTLLALIDCLQKEERLLEHHHRIHQFNHCQNMLVPCVGRLELICFSVMMLIDNAIKYAPSHSPISIEVHCHQTEVSICVTDQGIGFDPTRLDPMPFMRGNNTHATTGLGLGLSLVKQIMEQSQGKLTIHSTPQGSRVCLVLKVVDQNTTQSRLT